MKKNQDNREQFDPREPDYFITVQSAIAQTLAQIAQSESELDRRTLIAENFRNYGVYAHALWDVLVDKPNLYKKDPDHLIKKYAPTPGEKLNKKVPLTLPILSDYLATQDLNPNLEPSTEVVLGARLLLVNAKPNAISHALDTLLYVRDHFPDTTAAKSTTDFVVNELLNSCDLKNRKHRLATAGHIFHWQETAYRQDVERGLKEKNVVYSVRDNKPPTYSTVLEPILLPEDYTQVGYQLHRHLTEGSVSPSSLAAIPELKALGHTKDSLMAIISTFIESGFVRKNKKTGAIELTASGKTANQLTYSEVASTRIAQQIITDSIITKQLPQDLDEVENLHLAWREAVKKSSPSEIELTFDHLPRQLNLKDVLMGYTDTDPTYLKDLLARLTSLPKSQRPDYAVISGLIWPDHKNSQSDLRGKQNKYIDQFAAGKAVIDQLHTMGSHVIVNQSTEDVLIARDLTLDMLFLINNYNKGSEFSHISYWRQNQLMTRDGDKFDHLLYDFCAKIAIPYFIQRGRSPLDSEGVHAATLGKIHVPEMFVLYDTWRKLVENQKIPKESTEIIDPNLIPMPGRKFKKLDFSFGLELTVNTPNKVFNVEDIHHLGLTGTALPFSTVDKPETLLNNRQASGEPLPDLITTGHDHKLVLARTNGTWYASDPAPLRGSDPYEDHTRFIFTKDPTKREISTRGGHSRPSNIIYQLHPDHSLTLQIHNDRLHELSESLPEETMVHLSGDGQVGSQTADIAAHAKSIWWSTHELTKRAPVYKFNMGDDEQGKNLYKTHSHEGGVFTSLTRPDQQAVLYSDISEKASRDIPLRNLDNLILWHSVIGNHNWLDNQDAPAYGPYMTNAYLAHNVGRTFEEGMAKLKVAQSLGTETDGVIPLMHAAYEQIGAYGFYLTHRFVEKNQKAGGKGKHPIHQAYTFTQGLASEIAPIDFVFMGDMHIPALTEYNSRIFGIVPPLCIGSPYERHLALSGAEPGAVLIKLGRGMVPEITFQSAEFIRSIKINNGPLSDSQLADEHGLTSDIDHDPRIHSLYDRTAPKSALQKYILKRTQEIVFHPDTRLPASRPMFNGSR